VAYAPDIIVTQTGCDTHHADPLTDLAGTMRLYPALAARTHAIAHRICAGRWLIVGGGGYDPADVTPRAWTAFMGTVLGQQVDGVVLPAGWRIASEAKGGHPPLHLLDDPEAPAPRAPDPSFVASLDRIEAEALAVLRERFARESATSIEGAD